MTQRGRGPQELGEAQTLENPHGFHSSGFEIAQNSQYHFKSVIFKSPLKLKLTALQMVPNPPTSSVCPSLVDVPSLEVTDGTDSKHVPLSVLGTESVFSGLIPGTLGLFRTC